MSQRPGRLFLATAAARLAGRQLAHRGAKLLAALLGVMVAVVLMFTQLGFKGALYDSGVAVARSFDGEIVLTSRDFRTMSFNPPWMPRSVLLAAEAVDGVQTARPLYASTVQIANPSDGNFLVTWLYAFAPDEPVFTLAAVNRAISQIRLQGTALIDRQSRYELGKLAGEVARDGSLELVMPAPAASNQFVFTVVDTFDIGPTISADGNLITSDLNFYRYLKIPLDRVSFGIVKLQPGTDPVAAKAAIEQAIGTQARVFLKDEFIANEIDFYAYRTPIGFIFNVGLAVGIFVGVVFISQVLHGIINDNVREYAALRALGYEQRFFVYLVAFIAVAIAAATYLPSVAVALVIYQVAGSVTKLPLDLKTTYLVTVFAIVVGMGLVAALLSTKKLRSVDPVDLF